MVVPAAPDAVDVAVDLIVVDVEDVDFVIMLGWMLMMPTLSPMLLLMLLFICIH